MDDFKESASARHNRNETYELIDIMTAHTRPVQVHWHKIPALRKGSGHKVPPYIKKPFMIDPFCKTDCFLQGSDTQYINHISAQDPYPRIVGHHKTDSMGVCLMVCLCVHAFYFVLVFFSLLYNKLSLLNTLYVEQAGFELTEFHLPLSPKLSLKMCATMPSSFLSY